MVAERITPRDYDSTGTLRRIASYRPVPESVRELNRKIQSARHGGYLARPHEFARDRDSNIEVKLKRDAACAKGINMRRVMVAGTDWYLEAPDEESKVLIPYFERLIRKIRNFSAKRFSLTQAIFSGIHMQRMLTAPGNRRLMIGNLPDAKMGVPMSYVWWWPELVDVPAGSIGRDIEEREIEYPDGTSVRLPVWHYTTYDAWSDKWFRVEDSDLQQYIILEYHPDAFSLGFGEQLMDSMAVSFEAKKHLERQLLRGAARVAFPWVAVQIAEELLSGGGTPGDGYQTPEQVLLKYQRIFRKQESGNILVYGGSTKDVKPLNLEGTALSSLLALVKHYNDEIVETALAASMPTGGGGDNGSLARAAVEAGSTSRYIRSDIQQLEESLDALIHAIWTYNQENFSRIIDPATGRALSTFTPPQFRIGREESDDYEKNIGVLTSVANLTDVLVSEIHEKCGTTQPTAEQIATGQTVNLLQSAQMQQMASMAQAPVEGEERLQEGAEPETDQAELASDMMREDASRTIFMREFAGIVPTKRKAARSRRALIRPRNLLARGGVA